MSSWKFLKKAASDANEAAHAKRLYQDMVSTCMIIESLPESLKLSAMTRFLELKTELAGRVGNWTKKGALQIVRKLNAEARERKHLQRAEACGTALAAIWLEAHYRDHSDAMLVSSKLNWLASELMPRT